MLENSNPQKLPSKNIELKKTWKKTQEQINTELELAKGLSFADFYITQRYLEFFSTAEIVHPSIEADEYKKLNICQVTKIVFDPKEQINDKLISVYGSLHNLQSPVAIIINSKVEKIELYFATKSNNNPDLPKITLEGTLKGNFPGIDIKESLNSKNILDFIDSFSNESNIPKSLATVSLVPSERDEDKDKFIQGLEKFMSSMNGKVFIAVILATPVTDNMLSQRKTGFEEMCSQLSPHSKISISFANSDTQSVNEGISTNFTTSMNHSVSNSNGQSTSYSSGNNTGSSINGNVSGENMSFGFGSSEGSFSSFTSGTTFSYTVSNSTGKSKGDSVQKGESESKSLTETTTLTFENKTIDNLINKVCKQLERIDLAESYGMWDFCAYFFSDDIVTTTQAANIYKSTMMGQESSVEKAHLNIWNINNKEAIRNIIQSVKYLKHPIANIPPFNGYDAQQVTPTNMISGRELPIVLGLPRKSVPGVSVVEMAEFGRSVVFESPERIKRTIEIGSIYHMGNKETQRVPLDIDLLASHCFITGSSGSGKSYATYQLLSGLLEHNIKLLVIEPVKGEYKQVLGGLKNIRIFTTDPYRYKLLKINPFQFPDNLHVLTHIERLMQIFNASWSLYAAMPALLKEAVVKAYTKCGWDVINSIWIDGISDHKYPVFQDVLEILPKLINESDYSADSKGDYKGALLTRVRSMTTGLTRLLFENSTGIEDRMLFDSNTVIDLSEIGSDETIALLMGVIIMKLGEYRQSIRKASPNAMDLPLKHVTVLEEAHNLLKRTNKEQNPESANIVGKSVEMISNSIKEMRTYGEGFIIIDQSPMSVDETVIENTSTKIIMNTPARNACEELSSALSLNEEQSRELARLSTGVAAIFQKGWLTPVLAKIDKWDNRYNKELEVVDFNAFSILRGQLLNELLEQHFSGVYSSFRLENIIESSGIDKDKKKDIMEIILAFNNKLMTQEKLSYEDVGEFAMDISNCEELFNVLDDCRILSLRELMDYRKNHPEIIDKNHCARIAMLCTDWVRKFKNALQKYVIVENPQKLEDVVKALLYYYSNKGNTANKYTTIYTLMKEGLI